MKCIVVALEDLHELSVRSQTGIAGPRLALIYVRRLTFSRGPDSGWTSEP